MSGIVLGKDSNDATDGKSCVVWKQHYTNLSYSITQHADVYCIKNALGVGNFTQVSDSC